MADYGAGWIKKFDIQYTDVVKGVEPFAKGFVAIVGLVENPLDGSLVYVDAGTNTIGRISYTGNQPPVVQVSSDKNYGPSSLTINFKGDQSSDPEGGSLSYHWEFGDGASSNIMNPSHQYIASGPEKMVAVLTVTDNQNAKSADSLVISVNNTPPRVTILSPAKNTIYRLGADTTYTCNAVVTDAEQTAAGLNYQWQTFLRHNTHQHPEPIDTNKTTETRISRIGCNGDFYYWLVKLTVTDTAGLSSADSVVLTPNCNMLSLVLEYLHSFSVVVQPSGNLVKWTADADPELASFAVERSQDGHQFIPIHFEDAQQGNGQIKYSFLDEFIPEGENYYRLRLVDKTEGYHYSKTIKVIKSAITENQLVVVPNPVQADFTVAGYFKEDGMADLRITDLGGRVLQTSRETVNKGFNNILLRLRDQLPEGIYILEIRMNGEVRNTRLIRFR